MKLTKGTIIAALVIVCVLAAAFFLPDSGKDGGTAEEKPPVAEKEQTEISVDTSAGSGADADVEGGSAPEAEKNEVSDSAPPEASEGDVTIAGDTAPAEPETPQEEAPVPEEVPPAAPEDTEPKPLTCTLSINCASVLDNMDQLTPGKEDLIPADGCILPETTVEFDEGETVFDVMKRELKSWNIHFEYSTSALYDTSYIEGICNLYEFDCGELSGWEYAVNGTFYGYGSSQYTVSDGDVIEWVYTCDLGADIGKSS